MKKLLCLLLCINLIAMGQSPVFKVIVVVEVYIRRTLYLLFNTH